MTKEKIRKIYLIVLAAYVALVTAFYFVAGEQLWYKESDENIEMVDADSITEEINKNTTVIQEVDCGVDKLESFEFVFTKGYQEGNGNLTINIYLENRIVSSKVIPVKDIPEQERVYLTLKKPLNDVLNKKVKIEMSSDSEPGQGVSSMMYSGNSESSVIVNGKEIPGTLCFSLIGYDKISATSYYWFIMGGIGLSLAIAMFISYINYKNGKSDFLVVVLYNVERYRFLINQLVSRDFKTKYKRSILGVLWSFLNPLLTMLVQFLVFSTLFKVDTKNYPVYLISGVICFSFFSECTSMCLLSISDNASLITKVYIPKYIFPLAKTLSSSINLLISLIPMFLVTIISGTVLHISIILMIYFLACLVVFSLGVGMVLASLMVFFRDIKFLWSVMLTIWQYATPIFYPAEIIPEKYRFIVRFNPLYHFIGNIRKCLIDGISPEPTAYIYCFVFAIGALLVGSYIFKKTQDRFTLYL